MSMWLPLSAPIVDLAELPSAWMASVEPRTGRVVVTGRVADGDNEIITVVLHAEFAIDTASTDIRKGLGVLLADVLNRLTNPEFDQSTPVYDLQAWRDTQR